MQMALNVLAWIRMKNAHRSTSNRYKTQSSLALLFKKNRYFSYMRIPNTVQKLKKKICSSS